MAVLISTAGGGLHQLRDGVIDDVDLGRHLLTGFAGLARQAAHRVGYHGKTTASFACAGRFNRGVKGQQVGLCGNRCDVRGHGAQLACVGGQAANLGERLVAAGLGGFKGVNHLAQLAVALGQDFQSAIGILTVQLTGSVLRGLHGFLQAFGNPHKAAAQLDNGGFGLLARTFDLFGPDRHGTEKDFIELCMGGHGAGLSVMCLVMVQRLGNSATHVVLLGAGSQCTGTETDSEQCRTSKQIGRTRTGLREDPGNGRYDGNQRKPDEMRTTLRRSTAGMIRHHGFDP